MVKRLIVKKIMEINLIIYFFIFCRMFLMFFFNLNFFLNGMLEIIISIFFEGNGNFEIEKLENFIIESLNIYN